MEEYPTSPDGTDWAIYGDTPLEQWIGVRYEAFLEDIQQGTGCNFNWIANITRKTLKERKHD